ncbi:ATP synthase F0 subunit 8 (mitochondrion) [Salarias fasciatus]|uniref:ATP synthase complex subunit 8 n=1 Tax=Salarias fasciatus TaxID=181472 RepID=Q8HKT3_SALFA|nr:ATP synthase F0 subunit 8 [Salarias fasciatus]AOS51718.1 ATP synthase F0 subunit 8 [Salarias fasciatus]QUJ18193.1 ATP synthase protein 8 [Salarias fasciatus]BAC23765.1 ATPase subunit 8 [Salarias fasciatus]
MPQLNPAPWFMILFFSWLVFLTVIPPKILAHKFPNEPSLTTAEKTKTKSWTWPWY